jgi:uncharacterized protein YbjT (DUF2867 family)
MTESSKSLDMKLTANIIGASGLVGQQLINQLLDHPDFEKVRSFVRRPSELKHPKLDEIIIDFNYPESWQMLVQGDALFSSLGTTIKAAGSKDNQYKVDFTYQYEFAKAASQNGVGAYLLVSSMGANAQSSFFYPRIKGELEAAVSKLPFNKIAIFRPSILEGDRKEKRSGEKIGLMITHFFTSFMMKKYRPTPVDILAQKMIKVSLESFKGQKIITGDEIFNV